MLHITNGDSAASLIRRSGVPGGVLPWRDVLHEGPVPGGLALRELSAVRARFISSVGWSPSPRAVEDDFIARDDGLEMSDAAAEVVLWFEADLYDQLQLIQLLDWFGRHPRQTGSVTLIEIGEHEVVSPFVGFGQLTPGQIGALFPGRIEVTREHFALAQAVWNAFRASTPDSLGRALEINLDVLPFLHSAIQRL
ncbi:MAG: hypothetical protein ABI679_14265, partial [Gemmatimonadota bacterium]